MAERLTIPVWFACEGFKAHKSVEVGSVGVLWFLNIEWRLGFSQQRSALRSLVSTKPIWAASRFSMLVFSFFVADRVLGTH